jgi:hypothetical protein
MRALGHRVVDRDTWEAAKASWPSTHRPPESYWAWEDVPEDLRDLERAPRSLEDQVRLRRELNERRALWLDSQGIHWKGLVQ